MLPLRYNEQCRNEQKSEPTPAEIGRNRNDMTRKPTVYQNEIMKKTRNEPQKMRDPVPSGAETRDE
jgi:hypothetical protein